MGARNYDRRRVARKTRAAPVPKERRKEPEPSLWQLASAVGNEALARTLSRAPAEAATVASPAESPIKTALEGIKVEKSTETVWTLRPWEIFAGVPANTKEKKAAFVRLKTAVASLERAYAALENAQTSRTGVDQATKAFEKAVDELEAATEAIKEFVRTHDVETLNLMGEQKALSGARTRQQQRVAALEKQLDEQKKQKKPKQATLDKTTQQLEAAKEKLDDAVAALEEKSAALEERKTAVAAELEARTFLPTSAERTRYKIAVDDAAVTLHDYAEAYATVTASGLEGKAKFAEAGKEATSVADLIEKQTFSASRKRILAGIAQTESGSGGFTAMQSWDKALLTWGLIQWTRGAKGWELPPLLARIKEQAPEVFARRFQKYGIDVAGKKTNAELVLVRADGTELRGDAAAEAIGRTPELAAVMAAAGLEPDVQLAQLAVANDTKITAPLKLAFEVELVEEDRPEVKAEEAKLEEAKAAAVAGIGRPVGRGPLGSRIHLGPLGVEGGRALVAAGKKPMPARKASFKVGDLLTSEFGVGLLADRAVNGGDPAALDDVRAGLAAFTQPRKWGVAGAPAWHPIYPDESPAQWLARVGAAAEEAIWDALIHFPDRVAPLEARCDKKRGSFSP